MGEPDSGDVGGAEELRTFVCTPKGPARYTLHLPVGDVSAMMEWDGKRFLFRFCDERPEARRILGAAQEHDFTWSPDVSIGMG